MRWVVVSVLYSGKNRVRPLRLPGTAVAAPAIRKGPSQSRCPAAPWPSGSASFGNGTLKAELRDTAGQPGRVVIADSAALSFRQSQAADTKMLSDFDREEAETIRRINATRGTWQSYLLYTAPEMKVPTSRPGFIITLPPPSRKELERRRRLMASREKAAADRAPEPAPRP